MGSSSRKKSTSKKKSSKLSSKVHSMKKSKRTRSRKHERRRHDTSSDDDSVSSLSISSPSDSYSDSDDSVRRRSVKKREKRTRKTSSHRKDSKKRKKSRKDDNAKPRKKVKRDVKVSSASSDSRSFSSCDDSFSDSERREGGRLKKRSVKAKSLSPLSTSRSPSPSYVDEIETISRGEETFVAEKKSQRLRSVIVIPESVREEDEPEKDMHAEELVNDHDDYPYRSSSGEGGKKGSTPSPDASAYEHVENVGFTSELTEKGIEVESVSETKELEAILKQKALENLKKFRGARKTSVKLTADQKDVNSGDRNVSESLKTEADINKSFQLADSTVSDTGINKVQETTKHRDNEPPVLNKPVAGSSSSSGMGPALKQTKPPAVSADKTSIGTESSLSNPDMITRQKSQGTTAGSSALAENVESLNDQPSESKKDSPPYEHRTMSVMRGGEALELKYTIKKPTRAPRKFR